MSKQGMNRISRTHVKPRNEAAAVPEIQGKAKHGNEKANPIIAGTHAPALKVFTQMPSDFENKLGTPDLMVVFTSTCSHKMVNSVNQKSQKHDIPVARIHSASVSALKSILEQYCC